MQGMEPVSRALQLPTCAGAFAGHAPTPLPPPPGAAAMSFAFKRFSFFGQHDVPGHGFPADAACAVAGGGRVFVGCDGALHVLDEGLQAVAVVPAYGHKLLHLAWAEVGPRPRAWAQAPGCAPLCLCVVCEEGGVGSCSNQPGSGMKLHCTAASWS